MKLMRTHPLFHLSLYRQSEEREHVDKGDVHMGIETKEEEKEKGRSQDKGMRHTKGKTGQRTFVPNGDKGTKGYRQRRRKRK